jgi:hypothetical protein
MLFLRGDGDEGSNATGASSDLVKAATDPGAAAKVLIKQVADPKQGVTVRFPNDWEGDVDGPTVAVKDPGSTTSITITSPGPARDAKTIFRGAVKVVEKGFKGAKVSLIPAAEQKPVAGLPAAGAVIRGQPAKGVKRNALVLVARGKKRSYVITVLTPPGGGQLGVANLIIARGLTLSG